MHFDTWHVKYLCVEAHKAPGHIVDAKQPLKGVWMCGVSNEKEMEGCKGFESLSGETLGPYGKPGTTCKFRGECGECTKAGRATTMKEILGE